MLSDDGFLFVKPEAKVEVVDVTVLVLYAGCMLYLRVVIGLYKTLSVIG